MDTAKNVFKGDRFSFPLGEKTYIMGVLNVTPDSFSDGGRFNSSAKAVKRAYEMQNQGADIIDVGAMSTRPNSIKITAEEEIERLSCLPDIIKQTSVPISVDTFYPKTVEYALYCGASVINDVSGRFQSEIVSLVKEYNSGYIVMHQRCDSAEKQAEYLNGVVSDVNDYFNEMLCKLQNSGIKSEQICLDPGFGFSKNTAENLQILKNLSEFKKNGVCLLSALSRKRFIGDITGVINAEDRDTGTAAACVISALNGADMVRVHNVAVCREALLAADSIIYKTE